jgi:hypothetical protein
VAHICICDDEEGILRYLKKQMKGYQVDTFSRGSDLLTLLESRSIESTSSGWWPP